MGKLFRFQVDGHTTPGGRGTEICGGYHGIRDVNSEEFSLYGNGYVYRVGEL